MCVCDSAGRKRRRVEGDCGRVQGQVPSKTMVGAVRESRCAQCSVTESQLYSATTTTSLPTSPPESRGLLMDVKTTVQLLSTARQACCPLVASTAHRRPSNDLGRMTLTPVSQSDYWLAFRPYKHRSDLLGQYQSAIRQRSSIDDVIDDGCVRPEMDAAADEADTVALPRQPMSTRFSDADLCSPADQNQFIA